MICCVHLSLCDCETNEKKPRSERVNLHSGKYLHSSGTKLMPVDVHVLLLPRSTCIYTCSIHARTHACAHNPAQHETREREGIKITTITITRCCILDQFEFHLIQYCIVCELSKCRCIRFVCTLFILHSDTTLSVHYVRREKLQSQIEL